MIRSNTVPHQAEGKDRLLEYIYIELVIGRLEDLLCGVEPCWSTSYHRYLQFRGTISK